MQSFSGLSATPAKPTNYHLPRLQNWWVETLREHVRCLYIPIDLTRHRERAHCGRPVISQGQRWSNNYKATIAPTAGSRRAWLGRGDRGWATTKLRLKNYDYRARPGTGPGLRRTAVATAAERLPVCACKAKQTACWMSRQIQVNSRGDCAGTATASAGRKQNATQRSDRQPEPTR